jgi:hypothetical protein
VQDLDRIFGKRSHVAVLRVLFKAGEELSGREVQRRSGLSNRATMLALQSLCEQRVLANDVRSSSHRYRINRRHFLWSKAVRAALEAEEGFWEDLKKLLRRTLRPPPIAAIVTGPLARGLAGDQRELPLHLLYQTGRDRLQSYRGLERLKDRIDERYALRVNPTFMDLRTMSRPEFSALWDRIAREGLLVFGDLPVNQGSD